jgi:ABC-type glycerol-3-phosphate transport system substrate-binding protein
MVKRFRRSAALAAAASLVLVACGGDDSADGNGTAAADGDVRAYEGTELNLLLKEGYEIEAIQEFIGDFEEETGITVNIEVFDEPTARQQFVLDSTTQTGAYDVTSASFWNMPEFVRAGWLEPLDGYLDDTTEWLDMDAIPEGALQSMTIDDELYALPHTIIGGMFFYRTDIFEEQGIEPPQDTDEILAAAEQLADAGVDANPFVARGAPTFASLGTLLGWAYGYGAILFDENNQPNANSPEMIDAMEDFVALMSDYGPADAPSLTFTQAGEVFSSGNAAMMFDTSGFGTIFENPDQSQVAGDVGFTQPVGPAGNHLQWLYNEGLAISAFSENKEAAWLFLQWRMSEEMTTQELLEIGRTDVPNLNVLESDTYAQYAEENDLTDFTQILTESWDNATAEHWPFYAEFAEIGDTFAAGISSAIAGSTDVESALNSIQSDLEQLMERAGYLE